MAFGPDTVFSTLKSRLETLSTRERLVAENIANANTPGYTPNDVNLNNFESALRAARGGAGSGTALARTREGHLGAPEAGPRSLLEIRPTPDSETTIDGNQVVVEEQMARLSETRAAYEQAATLYQKGLEFLRIAARTPR